MVEPLGHLDFISRVNRELLDTGKVEMADHRGAANGAAQARGTAVSRGGD